MKATRRHDLMENELAKDIGKLTLFMKKYSGAVMGGLVAVVLVVLVITYVIGQSSRARQLQWQQYSQLSEQARLQSTDRTGETVDAAEQTRRDLQKLAKTASEPDLAAWAYLRAGQAAYAQVRLRLPELDETSRQALIEEARADFQIVTTKHTKNVNALAEATLGLGLLAETAGDYEKARELYNQAKNLGAKGAKLAAFQAGLNLQRLKEPAALKGFAQGTPPQPAPLEIPSPQAVTQ